MAPTIVRTISGNVPTNFELQRLKRSDRDATFKIGGKWPPGLLALIGANLIFDQSGVALNPSAPLVVLSQESSYTMCLPISSSNG